MIDFIKKMGWYVTCKFCKQEKYKHPNCGCLYNQYLLIQHKTNLLLINLFTKINVVVILVPNMITYIL